MNYLWGGMIFIGILYGGITGNLKAVSEATINSSKEAVTLCIAISGVTAMWVGIMRVAENAGLIDQITKKIQPILQFLYPDIPKNHPARGHIATNMIANVLGLGWAAAPAGLLTMESLKELNEQECQRLGNSKVRGLQIASPSMCTFLIVNISSLQLIPVNMIAFRSQYGSVNPTAIVGPAILATMVSTLVGVVFAKVMYKKDGLYKNRRISDVAKYKREKQ